MKEFIYSEGTYGTVLYRKSAEELWLEALAKSPTMELSWIDCDTRRKNVLLQVDDQVWIFDFRDNEDIPWSYAKGERNSNEDHHPAPQSQGRHSCLSQHWRHCDRAGL